MNRIIVIFMFWCCQAIFSQWSTDPTQNLRVTNRGLLPRIISDGTGGAYIAYNDMPLSAIHIYLQRLDKYGYRKFPGNGIMITDSSHFQTHRYFLVNDNQGGVIIVFDDSFIIDNEGYTRTHAQRFDSSGNKLWGVNGIAVSPRKNSRGLMLVSACSDDASGCYVFWGFWYDRNHIDLRAQHLDNQGNFMWDSSGVLITEQFLSYELPQPCLSVKDGKGGVICYYFDSTNVKLQRINSEGNFLWNEGIKPFPLELDIRLWVSVKEDGYNGVIITFFYEIYEKDFGWRGYVAAQRIDAIGNILWGTEGVIITDLADDQTFSPQLSVDEFTRSYIVWRDRRSGKFDVYAQLLNEKGQSQWQKNGIKVSIANSLKSVKGDIVLDSSSGILVVFSNYQDNERTLRAQRTNEKGVRLWTDDIIITRRKTKSEKVITDSNGGAIITWYETAPEIGIYAQQISCNGNLGEVIQTSVSKDNKQALPKSTHLFQCYPNPFNSRTVIKYYISKSSAIQINVYNITGKEVITLVDQKQNPGSYQIVWNGRSQKGGEVPSGIYFIQLRVDGLVQTKKVLFIK